MEAQAAYELVELAEQTYARRRDDDHEEWARRLGERAEAADAAADALLAAGDAGAALRLVGALASFWQATGRVGPGRALTERVVAAAGARGAPVERAAAHLALGELAFRQGDQGPALQATEAACTAAREAGDRDLEIGAEFNLARIAFRDGDAGRIRRHAGRMAELAGDDARYRYGANHMLAWAEHTAGHVDRAIELFEANIPIAREAGNRVGEAGEHLNLASLAMDHDHLDPAGSHLQAGLGIAAELDSGYLLPGVLTEVGRWCVLSGHPIDGLRLIAAGVEQYARAGLAPDPGDDAFQVALDQARVLLGPEEAGRIESEGRALALHDAIERARRVLPVRGHE